MNKKVSLGAAVAFAAIIAAITFIITMYFSINLFNTKVADVKERELLYERVAEIDTLVRQHYDGTIDENVLTDSISKGYLSGIQDKYAEYLTADELMRVTNENEGVTVGIGVVCKQDESGYLQITKVIADSPAQTAGFKAGDLIIKIARTDVAPLSFEDAVELMTGAAGTKVRVNIRRNGKDLKETELIRKNIEVPSVEYRAIDSIGYIKITDFNEGTVEQFEGAIKALTKQGAQSLIFDLRNNSGGTLDSVTKILDRLLPKGTIATSVNTKTKEETVLATSDDRQVSLPMVTLVNSNTASAAELFTAALRDYQMGESVGVTTYGKGVMQTLYTLSDGSGVRLTTAHFNPPSGQNFNGTGITPDYEVALTAEQEAELDTLDETNDPQLQKAIAVATSKHS